MCVCMCVVMMCELLPKPCFKGLSIILLNQIGGETECELELRINTQRASFTAPAPPAPLPLHRSSPQLIFLQPHASADVNHM